MRNIFQACLITLLAGMSCLASATSEFNVEVTPATGQYEVAVYLNTDQSALGGFGVELAHTAVNGDDVLVGAQALTVNPAFLVRDVTADFSRVSGIDITGVVVPQSKLLLFTYFLSSDEIYSFSQISIQAQAESFFDSNGVLFDVLPFQIEWSNLVVDGDGDGVPDTIDLFPFDPSEYQDNDADGIGNNADTDDDNDGVLDVEDAFPLDSTETVDTDSDGIGNNADTDDDGDGVDDVNDAFPLDANETTDTDNDGIGNNADTDDDNDGVLDIEDAFPFDAAESVDTDNDGIGNNADTDDDNDGVLDGEDAFPLDATETVDTDNDGVGNNADTDDDGDGITDEQELLDGTDPLDASDFIPKYDDLNGYVYHWAKRSMMVAVNVDRLAENGAVEASALTDAEGKYTFADSPEGDLLLSASLEVVARDLNRTITSADALAALKIAVGLNPNSDPDGAGPQQPLPVSPYQLVAADINRDGRVTSADALAILKIAVGLSDAVTPTWALIADSSPLWVTHNTKNSVANASDPYSVAYPEQTQVNFAAILVGDVNASWNAPAGAIEISDQVISQHARDVGAPLSTWAIVDSDLDGLSDTEEALLGTSPFDADSDQDGVNDAVDNCQNTSIDAVVDAVGCSLEQNAQLLGFVPDAPVISSTAHTAGDSPVIDQTKLEPEYDLLSLNADLYLRGDMNDWGTDLPMVRDEQGNWSVKFALLPGTYGFKFASRDWMAADFGAAALVQRNVKLGEELPAVANSSEMFVIDVSISGIYEFRLERGLDRSLLIRVTEQ